MTSFTKGTTDPLTHTYLLKELCDVLERREMTPVRLATYERAVSRYPIEALKQTMSAIYAQSPLPSHMPGPYELADMVRRHAPASRLPGSAEEERWRRRYDAWQQGRFSDEALSLAYELSDEELGVGRESSDTYLACQEPDCPALIPWPPADHEAGRAFCPRHQQARGTPATTEDKRAFLARLGPRARAFVRSLPFMAPLMVDLPVTSEEQAYAEVVAAQRAHVVGKPAQSGVNPKLFSEPTFFGLPTVDAMYAQKRQIVAGAGFRFDSAQGFWRRGRTKLSDEQIDGMELSVLADVVQR